MSQAENLIAGSQTTPASTWRGAIQLQRLPRIGCDQLLPPGRRLVVVAPHPDDEVLACGGLLASLANGAAGLLISVTDGESSHPGSSRWTPERLRAARREESRTALSRLGLDLERWDWQRLQLPDSGVDAEVLADRLNELLTPGDQVISTWSGDGHCDHEATGRACAWVAERCGARFYEAPIWAWHWSVPGDPRLPWARACRFDLMEEAVLRKRDAILAHASQHQGPEAVLSAELLETLLQPYEIYFR